MLKNRVFTRFTKGLAYAFPANTRAQCVEIMFSNIYTDDDWTLGHWDALMLGFTTSINGDLDPLAVQILHGKQPVSME